MIGCVFVYVCFLISFVIYKYIALLPEGYRSIRPFIRNSGFRNRYDKYTTHAGVVLCSAFQNYLALFAITSFIMLLRSSSYSMEDLSATLRSVGVVCGALKFGDVNR
jgi:hypothetical protein